MQNKVSRKPTPELASNPAVDPVAVIDVGSTAVRFVIAQSDGQNGFRILESLQQEVSLGRDTFTKGFIGREAVEKCVKALGSFRRLLDEYGIRQESRIRAVATNAVREAGNRDSVLDRIYIATGIRVEAIDEAEVHRYTYLSVLPSLKTEPVLHGSHNIIAEAGGGSTEILVVREGHVVFSRSFRLGAFRMREDLERHVPSQAGLLGAMETQMQRMAGHVIKGAGIKGKPHLVAVGGDARLVASALSKQWGKRNLVRLRLADFAEFARKTLARSVDDLVRKYELTYPEAETLGPALLTYVQLGNALGVKSIFVTPISMRDGMLYEMTSPASWTDDFWKQVLHAALELGRKYEFGERHGEFVSELCRRLFDLLKPEHKLPSRYGLVLRIAALLHEIGTFVGSSSHHKHSMYLILNSNLFGLGSRDALLTALIARYHRKALPRLSHDGYGSLNREERITVSKLSALLRVADALDRSHTQRIRVLDMTREKGRLVLTIANAADLALEELALSQKGKMFEDVYGMPVFLRKAG